jgi:hypothetical protein
MFSSQAVLFVREEEAGVVIVKQMLCVGYRRGGHTVIIETLERAGQAMRLTTYTVKTTLLDDDRWNALCHSLMMYFTYCHPIERIGDAVTIKIDLDGWSHYYDDYFDEKKDDGIIGDWTYEPAN